MQLFTQASPWFILLCLLVGAVYAFVLYQKKPVWSRITNLALAGLRFVLVASLCFLLLSPFVKQNRNTTEKPTVVFAVDNSLSVALGNDSSKVKELMLKLAETSRKLEGQGIETAVQTFGNLPAAKQATSAVQRLPGLPFNSNFTNLSQLLNTIQTNYEGRNLASVVLISDGIYNQGVSPAYLTYPFAIHTIGLGDTIPKKDINLKAVYSNKVAYLGNQFPMVAEVHTTGFINQNLVIALKKNGKVLDRKTIRTTQNQAVTEVNFLTSSTTKGMQHYTLEAETQPGEFTTQNNVRDAYVDIIDGKEKILLIALAPHPDIKAIKSVIEKNENYELVLQIVGSNAEGQARADEGAGKYDLVIAHQLPDNYNAGSALVKKYADQGTPVWYIIGGQSSINQLNTMNSSVFVNARQGQIDQVTPSLNPIFSLFKIENDPAAVLQKLPPVSVPFGDYRVAPGSEVILYQRVGNLVTTKPLLVVSTQKAKKSAVMLGEGLWEWRLEEYALTEKHDIVDQIVLKLIQYLSSKEDKRKLRVYPISEEFYDYEKAVFEAEAYNDIYEKIYDQKIRLDLTDENGKVRTYSFTTSESNSRFEITGLPQGVYRYKASASILGKAQTSEGEFTVKNLQLEALNTTADHNLLLQVAQQSNGRFFLPQQADQLQQFLTTNRPPDLIQSQEELLEIINLKWIFFLLLAFITAEWGLRKYSGEY
ncbi:MAG: vWA domain-containing protein [Bacteroidota bacterium]